jgi:hypothetical protein
MSFIPNVYSLSSIVGIFSHPLVGGFSFAGEIGVGSISFEKTTTRTVLDVAGDGAIMTSALPGNNGLVRIDIQQVSPFQGYLTAWVNALYAAQSLGDVSTWALGTLNFTSIVDGSVHIAVGVSPTKEPVWAYGAQGQHLTWELLAADLVSIAPAVLNL